MVLVAGQGQREVAAHPPVRAGARPSNDRDIGSDVDVVRARRRVDWFVGGPSPELACNPLDVEPEGPVPELELNLARVLGVDFAVGLDGNGGAVVADGTAQYRLEGWAVTPSAAASSASVVCQLAHFAQTQQGNNKAAGNQPGPGTTKAAATTGTRAATSAESDLTSSSPRPGNGAAAASSWAGSNTGRNAVATPASTVCGAIRRNGANTPQPGPPTASGVPEGCPTSTDSPLSAASTPTTERSRERRSGLGPPGRPSPPMSTSVTNEP